MQNLTTQEQGYLQQPEGREATSFNTEAAQEFMANLRTKLDAVLTGELQKLVDGEDITEAQYTASMETVGDYLSDMLGQLPVWDVARRNDSLDDMDAAYNGAQE